jgi:hypothetical protein
MSPRKCRSHSPVTFACPIRRSHSPVKFAAQLLPIRPPIPASPERCWNLRVHHDKNASQIPRNSSWILRIVSRIPSSAHHIPLGAHHIPLSAHHFPSSAHHHQRSAHQFPSFAHRAPWIAPRLPSNADHVRASAPWLPSAALRHRQHTTVIGVRAIGGGSLHRPMASIPRMTSLAKHVERAGRPRETHHPRRTDRQRKRCYLLPAARRSTLEKTVRNVLRTLRDYSVVKEIRPLQESPAAGRVPACRCVRSKRGCKGERNPIAHP